MNYAKELWFLINDKFEGNPLMLFLSLGLLFGIGKIINSIPALIRWRRGEIKKDKEEREDARKTLTDVHGLVQTTSETVEKQEKHLKEMNGTLKNHVANNKIHTPKSELVTAELFANETKHIGQDLKAIFRILDNK